MLDNSERFLIILGVLVAIGIAIWFLTKMAKMDKELNFLTRVMSK